MSNNLPAWEPNLLPEGPYRFKITEEPEKRRGSGDGIYIIFRLKASDGVNVRKYNDVFVPWEERYKDLLLALGGEPDEKGVVHLAEMIDVVGKTFEAEIVHVKDQKDPTKTRDKIANIKVNFNEEEDVPMDEPEVEDDIPF